MVTFAARWHPHIIRRDFGGEKKKIPTKHRSSTFPVIINKRGCDVKRVMNTERLCVYVNLM